MGHRNARTMLPAGLIAAAAVTITTTPASPSMRSSATEVTASVLRSVCNDTKYALNTSPP